MNRQDELTYRIALSMLPGMDTRLADTLTDTFGTVRDVFEATETELKAVPGVPRSLPSAQTRHEALRRAGDEAGYLDKTSVTPVWYRDEGYPSRLLRGDRAPAMIYTLGDTDLNRMHTIAIVGTRHATAYGDSFTDSLVSDLADRIEDIATVSGLAYGIDIAAHRASLKAGIPTIAIVGHGLSRIYPAIHRDTAARIVRDGGAIVSDYPHDAPVNKYNFLARNRLIATLCDALVVVESGERGGALATARIAAKCGIPVFALPGRITDTYSIGCNHLIASRIARPVESADDIITCLGWTPRPKTAGVIDPVSNLNSDERRLLHTILTAHGCDNDLLAATTGLPASTVMTLMIGLEMRGLVAALPGNRYQVIQTIDPLSLLDR